MLLCRSKALTRPSSFLLLRKLMRTWVLLRTDCWRTDSGPCETSYSSSERICDSESSERGVWRNSLEGGDQEEQEEEPEVRQQRASESEEGEGTRAQGNRQRMCVS